MSVLNEEREQGTWCVRLEKNGQGEEVHVARSKGCKVSMVQRMDVDGNRLCSECWRVLRFGESFKAFVRRRNIDDDSPDSRSKFTNNRHLTAKEKNSKIAAQASKLAEARTKGSNYQTTLKRLRHDRCCSGFG